MTYKSPVNNNLYEVRNNRTNALIGTYQTSAMAHAKADKLDLAHGAIAYKVVILWDAKLNVRKAA